MNGESWTPQDNPQEPAPQEPSPYREPLPPHDPRPPLLRERRPVERRKLGCVFWVFVGATVFFAGLSFLLFLALSVVTMGEAGTGDAAQRHFTEHYVSGNRNGMSKVLMIPVSGIITDVSESGFMGSRPGMVSAIRAMLRTAEESGDIRAILLRINSPGGGVTESDTIYHLLSEFRAKTEIPVVAYFESVAASGGYYVAASAEHIVANPTCVTGSIGVIMPLVGVQDLLDKIGVEPRAIKSGKFKDMASMYRPLGDEERQMLQRLVDTFHGEFVSVVHQGFQNRGVVVSRESLENLCDGRIFSGREAKQNQFVDEVGYYEDAVIAAASKANLPLNDVKVVAYQRRPALFEALLSEASQRPREIKVELPGLPKLGEAKFMYLWTVGAFQAAAAPQN